jgi:hypothetical protein
MTRAFVSMAFVSDAMRVVFFIVLTTAIFLLVLSGIWATSSYWLPWVTTVFGSQLQGNKFLVLIPAAIATIIAAAFNGIAAIITANAQRAAGLELARQKSAIDADLDERRNAFLKELEEKRAEYTKALEDHKAVLTKSLDEHRDGLSLRRAQIDTEIAQLTEAHETAASYRFEVGQLQMGTYSRKEASLIHPKLHLVRDRLARSGELYKAWCLFMQFGHVLEEKAAGQRPLGQRRVWTEIPPKHGDKHLGLLFAESVEGVLTLLNAEADRVRTRK